MAVKKVVRMTDGFVRIGATHRLAVAPVSVVIVTRDSVDPGQMVR